MANPLSVAGSAVGVVSLGLRVTGGITEYIDALQSRDQYIESVRQKNDTLRKTLQIVEASLSRLQQQGDHQAAAQVVRECLDTSMKELKALEDLITELTVGNPSLPRRESKLKTQGKKLMYPFSRPKLEQLGTRLGHINAALQLALQTLGLSISQLSTEKLVTLEATSQAMSTDLLMVQSEVSAIGNPLKDMRSTLSGFESRFENLENLCKQLLESPAICRTTPETTSNMITNRLLSKPGVLRDMCDASLPRGPHKSNQALPGMNNGTAHTGSRVSTYPGGRFSCLCRNKQRLQRKNTVWGSVNISVETTSEEHLPGCPATQILLDTNESRKVSLTYTGLRSLLSSAIEISFMMPSGAGGWSLSSNFTYYPIVDPATAPAFKILSLIESSQMGCLEEAELKERLFPSAVAAMLRLFQTKKASPRAVDAENKSLIHYLLRCIRNINTDHLRRGRHQAEPNVLVDLLEYLLINKAPSNDYDTYGYTPMIEMYSIYNYAAVTDPLYSAVTDLVLRSNTEDNVVCMSGQPFPMGPARIIDRSGREIDAEPVVVALHFLSSSTRVAEAYGCGPLSVAILFNNLEEVEHLVKNHPATLAERNLFGHSPMHLAADKPPMLRLMVKAADAGFLNQKLNESGMTPLETALMFSGLICREQRDSQRMCRKCTCAESAVIILKADCAVPVPKILHTVLASASKRCRLKFIRHIKDRRDRLKQLAIDNLPAAVLSQLGLSPEHVLDSLAPRVTQLLQDHGVCIPEALSIGPGSAPVYQKLCSPSDAELFFRIGFRDLDSWRDVDRAELRNLPSQRPSYLHWLAAHGARSCLFKSFESPKSIFVAHFTFFEMGKSLTSDFLSSWNIVNDTLPLSPEARKGWFQTVNSTVLSANITDSCRCRCSDAGCTPLTSLLKGSIQNLNWRGKVVHLHGLGRDVSVEWSPLSKLISGFIPYLESFWFYFEARHHSEALRYLTFTALGIGHCCCEPRFQFSNSPEETENEQGYELKLLEELLREFNEEMTKILQDPDLSIADLTRFWSHTWVDRMDEVLRHLEGDNLTDGEIREAEEIGVVWDKLGPEPPEAPTLEESRNPYNDRTFDYWMYELYKIEAAC
ncbi:unnamed protein product [Clonostachys rosea]|uniref:Fungal N-terminal domain-containing protein n=1 Tax=Bionectria ochroleuca TaxID=29856 RepID=A0ABY6URW2_BIOOC|nr:unnamed protein product [Clonostachys rosea]